mmetsp:Transcript_10682/g.32913  ORF Transcript_10682/g.32913 Transcript_10682/m.32913 type:complete len:283 (-) Transcript_10682:48-896(-)|eukprot:scaffold31773_cov32-Tisochrysis_lutea.AAC.1
MVAWQRSRLSYKAFAFTIKVWSNTTISWQETLGPHVEYHRKEKSAQNHNSHWECNTLKRTQLVPSMQLRLHLTSNHAVRVTRFEACGADPFQDCILPLALATGAHPQPPPSLRAYAGSPLGSATHTLKKAMKSSEDSGPPILGTALSTLLYPSPICFPSLALPFASPLHSFVFGFRGWAQVHYLGPGSGDGSEQACCLALRCAFLAGLLFRRSERIHFVGHYSVLLVAHVLLFADMLAYGSGWRNTICGLIACRHPSCRGLSLHVPPPRWWYWRSRAALYWG